MSSSGYYVLSLINATVLTYNINRHRNKKKKDSDSSIWFTCLALWLEALEVGAPINIPALLRVL